MDNRLNLYQHNLIAYENISNKLNTSNRAAVVQATGTGKTRLLLQLALDNKDKKILCLEPTNAIIEHIKEIVISSHLSLDIDFPNLELRTYSSLINLSREEINEMNIDYLVVDEFHHLGAPVWGRIVNDIIDSHEQLKVLGLSAYTVRDRGTSYERDMALEDGEEIFSNCVVNRYDICNGMIEGILPKPIYRSAYVDLLEEIDEILDNIESLKVSVEEKNDIKKQLVDARRRIHEAPGIKELIKKYLKKGNKVIYFCPPYSQEGVNDIDSIIKEIKTLLLEDYKEEDIIIYKTTSSMGKDGQDNRIAFYNDKDLLGNNVSDKLRIMFAINQYNEGVHAPGVDRVIMGRGTCSDIVFFEQLGRCLSVNENYYQGYNKYINMSYEELINICHDRNIEIKEGILKEELVEKIISPIIIDLAGNIEFIKELENKLGTRIKEETNKNLSENKREIKLSNPKFDIVVINEELFEILDDLKIRLHMSWIDKYNLAKSYYEHYGNLLIPATFKTKNGYEYDQEGINLGMWISTQRLTYDKLSEERRELLNKIGFVVNKHEEQWQQNYNLAKSYYEHYGNLLIPNSFNTKNGYDYDPKGVKLGSWINTQRQTYDKLSEERRELLNKIGFVVNQLEEQWQQNYNLAKSYYEHHGNLLIPHRFKTKNGYEYDPEGSNLGIWMVTQRQIHNKLSEDRRELLNKIGFVVNTFEEKWKQNYNLAKTYYEHHGNLLVPQSFKTKNGYEYDLDGANLGAWINTQRHFYDKISKDKRELLNKIGFINSASFEEKWQQNYELAKLYYEHHGNLLVPQSFKTKNGYEYDLEGTNLGAWINTQRQTYDKLSEERRELLNKIGFINSTSLEEKWQQNYNLAKFYYEHHDNLLVPQSFKTKNGYEYDLDGSNLGTWINTQRQTYDKLSEKRRELLNKIGFINSTSLEEQWQQNYNLAKLYYEHHGNLLIPYNFKTKNGYEYDLEGVKLWPWINNLKRRYFYLSKEKIQLLNEIGMKWKENDINITNLCKRYDIDISKNKKILGSISYVLMMHIIYYLEENNIPIVDNNGILHEIFGMSSSAILEKYGLTFPELVNSKDEDRKKRGK